MSQGPSLQGQIVINTQSVDKAIASVKKLQTNVQKSFGLGGQAAANFSKTLDKQTQSYDKVAQSNQKYQNIIAKAANKVANYEAAVRKSNNTDAKKADLIKRATAELKGFEQSVRAGATSGKSLDNVSTQLSVSMGQLKRDLASASQAQATKVKTAKALEQAQIRTDKAVSQSNIQYRKAAQAVRDSSMAEADKLTILGKLDAEHKKLTNTLTNGNTTTRQASSAQNRFRESLAQVNAESRKSRLSQQTAATNRYATEMRNLSTSVVVALGPLSGVASRLTALTTLFNRNAASIATVLAAMTGLSVLFSRSATAAEEAEKQMFRINAQLDIMGDRAEITGDEINEMAHQIAAGTLLSAKQVRDSAGALLEFGGIGRSQFADVTKVAQGMSAVFGGNLKGNIRKLGRAIEEPVEGLQRLERSGIILDETTTDLIETLSAQGRTFEATNVLLKETVSLQKAAEAEAKGLAGAYDTVSGNLDRMYENLFIASGASDALAKSVMDVANAIASFSQSNDAKALGQVFVEVAETAGTAFKFLIDNIGFLAGGLAFIAGSVIPKAITAFVTMTKVGVANLSMGLQVAISRLGIYTSASVRATAATKGLNTALKANPFIAVASGVLTLVSAVWSYNSAMEAIENTGKTMASTLIGQIEDQITVRNDLTKSQAVGFRQELNFIEKTIASQTEKYNDAQNREKSLRQAMFDRFKQEQGMFSDLGETVAYKEQISSLEGLVELSKTLKGAEKEQVDQLILAVRSSNAYKAEMEKTEQAAKRLAKTIKGVAPSAETNNDLKRQLETVNELTKEYLKEEAAVNELEASLDKTQNVQKGLLEQLNNVESHKEWETITAAIDKTDEIIEKIKEELKELSEIELSKEAEKLAGTLGDLEKSYAFASMSIGASEAEVEMIKLRNEVQEIKETSKDLFSAIEPSELAALGQYLPGVDEASGIEAVKAAYIAYVQTLKESELEANRVLAAESTLKEFRTEQDSQIVGLVKRYGELQRAAIRATGEPDQSIADWYIAEQAKVEAQAKKTATTPFTDLETIKEEFETRRQTLEELYGKESEDYERHLKTMKEQADRNKAFMSFAQGAEQAQDIVTGAMGAMEAAGKENTAAYKAMAIAQATINAALAVSQVLADTTLHTGVKIAMAGVIGATAGAQIAAIQSANYADGGYVSGPGTSRSDSIAANLSNGEFVMQAEAVRKIGMRNLEMMNGGHMPAFSSGGPVGTSPMPIGMSGNSSGGINFTVIDNSSGDKKYRTEEGVDSNGNREMKLIIDNTVKQGLNSGQYDREMGNSFGVKRKGRRV